MLVSVKDAVLFYTTRGRGPSCLVPSVVGTKPNEYQMPQRLSEHLQLVFVDLRGSGRSTGTPADFALDRVAEDLEAVRLDLGVPQVAVIGHSILGAVAIEYRPPPSGRCFARDDCRNAAAGRYDLAGGRSAFVLGA